MSWTVNQRFAEFVEYTKLGNKEFAESINAQPNEVTNWKAETKIPLYRLETILNKYKNLNARWLITGEGKMLNEENSQIEDPTSPYNIKNTEDTNVRLWKRIEDLEALNSELCRALINIREKGCIEKGEPPGGVEKNRDTG